MLSIRKIRVIPFNIHFPYWWGVFWRTSSEKFSQCNPFSESLRRSIIFATYPSENVAMLFFPFRKEVLQTFIEELYSKSIYEWCNTPLSPSEIYSRYFHPSEIDILDNNPFEKSFFPSIDSLRVSYETCWLLCGTSRLTNFREFVPFFQTSSNKVTHQM